MTGTYHSQKLSDHDIKNNSRIGYASNISMREVEEAVAGVVGAEAVHGIGVAR